MEKQLQFRQAERQDVPLILRFIRDLAAYEKMEDQVVADEATLAEWLFERRSAEVCFAMLEGKEVGFALYFHNFSTFLGRAGLYLEDLYVLPQYRGQGIGKAILRHLAHCSGTWLRPPGVVVSGLEQPQHRLLPLSGRPAHGRVDGVPPDRGYPPEPGGREVKKIRREAAASWRILSFAA